ncbi:hypothetical protein A2U01_0118189, partial [Trifolium medium]|nr:hypothetical protein [Trifolium medium]
MRLGQIILAIELSLIILAVRLNLILIASAIRISLAIMVNFDPRHLN